MWGADWIDALSRYDGLLAVRLTSLGSYAGGLTTTYTRAPAASVGGTLQVLANFDVVAVDSIPADRIVLDAFARRTSDQVWTLSTASLIAAVDVGRTPGELTTFLNERAVHGVPATVRQLLADVEDRTRRVRDLGLVRVIECADPAVAVLLSRDRTLRGLCSRIGERHLMLDPANEPKVRAALRKLGYPIGPTT
jgi:hypothetical protein